MNVFSTLSLSKEYRPELNGLRGLAVLLVLLFHLDYEWMQGGYLGVDVFLVISGYFISKNILYGIQRETFTFLKFYTKRLRRLFPALIITIILTLIVGYLILTPAAYERLGSSSLFSSLSLANIFFWNESGYFDSTAHSKPLLHMWSLSLEEQFYLLWPFALFLINRFAKKFLLPSIIILIIISILLCELYIKEYSEAVFFLIPFRMFEFLLGAVCIYIEQFTSRNSSWIKEVFFLTGVFIILYAAIEFNYSSPMPGLLSLIPCCGAMLIIITGKNRISSWLLKNTIMESIGKASYSIYLAHWPIIVFYQYFTLKELSFNAQIILGVISIAFGFFMWHYIENTFRYPKKKRKFDKIWISVPLCIVVIVIFSKIILKTNGFSNRFSKELYMTSEEILDNRKSYWQDSYSNAKVLGGLPGSGEVLFLGNSHSIDLIYAFRLNGFKATITSLQSGGKCYNFGTAEKNSDKDFCKKKRIENLNNQNWSKAKVIYLHDDWPRWDKTGFREIIKKVRGLTTAPIYVIGPKLVFKKHVPEIVHQTKTVIPKIINENAMEYAKLDLKEGINESLKFEFQKNPYYNKNNIHFIDLLSIQGGKNHDHFEVVSNNRLKFLYFDAGHLTKQGARELGKKLKEKHPELFTVLKKS